MDCLAGLSRQEKKRVRRRARKKLVMAEKRARRVTIFQAIEKAARDVGGWGSGLGFYGHLTSKALARFWRHVIRTLRVTAATTIFDAGYGLGVLARAANAYVPCSLTGVEIDPAKTLAAVGFERHLQMELECRGITLPAVSIQSSMRDLAAGCQGRVTRAMARSAVAERGGAGLPDADVIECDILQVGRERFADGTVVVGFVSATTPEFVRHLMQLVDGNPRVRGLALVMQSGKQLTKGQDAVKEEFGDVPADMVLQKSFPVNMAGSSQTHHARIYMRQAMG